MFDTRGFQTLAENILNNRQKEGHKNKSCVLQHVLANVLVSDINENDMFTRV